MKEKALLRKEGEKEKERDGGRNQRYVKVKRKRRITPLRRKIVELQEQTEE